MKTKAKKVSAIPVVLQYNKNTMAMQSFMFLQGNNLLGEIKYKATDNANQNTVFASISHLMIAELMDE